MASKATSTSKHLPVRGRGSPALPMPMRSVPPCGLLRSWSWQQRPLLTRDQASPACGQLAAPILSLTPLIATARQLTPVWGIHSVVVENEITDEASMTKLACDAALAGDFGKPGDNIVIVAGIPFGASGTTNLLRIAGLPAAADKLALLAGQS